MNGKPMNRKMLAGLLNAIILGAGICGLLVYFVILPDCGHSLASLAPEYSFCYWPWLIFLWLTSIPCGGVLLLGWKVACSIREEREFTQENSRRFRWAARLIAGDSVFLVAGCVLYWLLGMAHPSMVILGVGVGLVGGAAAVAAEALAQLTDKAAVLQEQSDWTV